MEEGNFWKMRVMFVLTSPRSSVPKTNLRHRTPVLGSGSGTRKGGPIRTYQKFGQSSDIGTIDPGDGDRH